MNTPDVDSWDGTGQLPVLYSKTAAGAYNYWQCWVQGEYVCVRWGQLGTENPQEASFKCEPKNEGRANATTAEVQAIKEAVAKWKKQVKKKYHWDREHWEGNRNLKPMLAKEFSKEEKKVVYPAYIQPKFNGVRCLAFKRDGAVVLQSRGGDPYSIAHIERALLNSMPDNVILDGEIYHHGTSLQTITSWVRRPQEASANLLYVIYDVVDEEKLEAVWPERHALVRHLFGSLWSLTEHACLAEAQTALVHSKEEVKYYHDQFVQLGFEGAMVRTHDGVYKFGYRSSSLLKMKEFQDDEFEIVGWARGKGKFENVAIIRCKTKDGKEFDCTPMGTEEERLVLLANAERGELVGKYFTVRFFAYTDDGIPQFPVGLGVREPGT